MALAYRSFLISGFPLIPVDWSTLLSLTFPPWGKLFPWLSVHSSPHVWLILPEVLTEVPLPAESLLWPPLSDVNFLDPQRISHCSFHRSTLQWSVHLWHLLDCELSEECLISCLLLCHHCLICSEQTPINYSQKKNEWLGGWTDEQVDEWTMDGWM